MGGAVAPPVRRAPDAEPPVIGAQATVSAAVSRAGTQFATSSSRADAQPKRA